jgi:hypothetical protein
MLGILTVKLVEVGISDPETKSRIQNKVVGSFCIAPSEAQRCGLPTSKIDHRGRQLPGMESKLKYCNARVFQSMIDLEVDVFAKAQ